MPAPITWRYKRAQLAEASKRLPASHPRLTQLRHDMATLRAEERITQILAEAPELSTEQRNRLVAIIQAGDAA